MAGNIQSNSNYSPSFIKAKTPEQLESEMLSNNIKNGKVFHYREISFANGFWYAWYDVDHTDRVKIIRKNNRRGDK